jgi:hypothetical protein
MIGLPVPVIPVSKNFISRPSPRDVPKAASVGASKIKKKYSRQRD